MLAKQGQDAEIDARCMVTHVGTKSEEKHEGASPAVAEHDSVQTSTASLRKYSLQGLKMACEYW